MYRVWPLVIAVLVCTAAAPVTAQAGLMTIDATPRDPQIGDTVRLSGTVRGINTIAVYLFVTGPGLDPRGVTLENLNLATGQGLFTTAPVNMENGTWSFAWDTSVILGTLMPGDYTVHVVSSPVQRVRFSDGESASVRVSFRPSEAGRARTPLDPPLAVIGFVIAAILLIASGVGRK